MRARSYLAGAFFAGLLSSTAATADTAVAPDEASPSPAAAAANAGGGAAPADNRAGSSVADEMLLRPRRHTEEGRHEYERGNHPDALAAFEKAAATRPGDPATQFNLADALYKAGRYDEAEAIYRRLAADVRQPLAAPSRYNLGNTLYQKQDYPGAVSAYKDALHIAPEDEATRRNLELALRQIQEQKRQQQRDQQQKDQKDDKKDEKDRGGQGKQDQKKDQKQDQPQPQPSPSSGPKSADEKERERFEKEARMPKERALQLLDALQQGEKDQQKKLLQASPAPKRAVRDW